MSTLRGWVCVKVCLGSIVWQRAHATVSYEPVFWFSCCDFKAQVQVAWLWSGILLRIFWGSGFRFPILLLLGYIDLTSSPGGFHTSASGIPFLCGGGGGGRGGGSFR